MVDVMLLCTTEANFKMIESVMIYFHSHLYSRVDWVCTIMNTVLTCCKGEQFQLERCDATQILKTCLVWLLFFHCKHLLSFISWAVLGATKHLLGGVYLKLTEWQAARLPALSACLHFFLPASLSSWSSWVELDSNRGPAKYQLPVSQLWQTLWFDMPWTVKVKVMYTC